MAALAVAYAAVMLGSWTRIEGAGMTIPEWPWRPGALVPAMGNGTVWEWTHRLLVFILSPLIVVVIVAAWRQRSRPFIGLTARAVAILFVLQVLLGAATVRLANSPASVVIHWGTAMALIAALAAMAVFARAASQPGTARPGGTDARLVGILAGTATIAFATMCIGAYVSSSGAGLACISIPGCA
ncbi:MAG: COX15/CtaA family protein, partial [Candidatus Eremiobacteraeota bacterium]|nr:COX15/CtaA family protein [Candidatus Eremiobacteraeota bacterium]